MVNHGLPLFVLTVADPNRALPNPDPASYLAEVSAPLLVAAAREDDFSREPARIIRGKKYGHARNVLGLAQAALRRTGDHLLLKLRAHDARRVRTLRFGSTGD